MARVLTIAGSDNSGGAGIQADIKTITMLGGYAMTALTAVTAQDGHGVAAIRPVPVDLTRQQIATCIDDIGVDAIKIGMVGSGAHARAVAAALTAHLAPGAVPIVLDPVLAASTGDALATPDLPGALIGHLIPLVGLVTPNLPELAALTGLPVAEEAERIAAARHLVAGNDCHVLVKGGHDADVDVTDLLVPPDRDPVRFTAPRLPGVAWRGTGCTLASAIACLLGQGRDMVAAVAGARDFVRLAIRAAPGLGRGAGPLGHAAVQLGTSLS